MKWSIRVFTVAGIGVYVHLTFLMLIAFFALMFLQQGGVTAAAQGMAFILTLFGCVLLHEFGHALTARRFGVKTRDITLLPIGGLARLERIPREPLKEFLIAIAGPLVNIVIALMAGALMLLLGISPLETSGAMVRAADETGQVQPMLIGWPHYLADVLRANVIIFLFNLIPAFPMDGGRILRSLLALRLDHNRATSIAASIGQALAIAFGLFGLLQGNPILVLIAVFVFLGAAGEASAAQLHYAFRGLPTSTGMITDFKTLARDDTIASAVELLLRGDQVDFPVVEDGGIAGILTRQQLVESLGERGPETSLRDVTLKEVEPVDAEVPLDQAYDRMAIQGIRCLPIVRGGKLVGLITADNIAELAMVRRAMDRGS